MTETLVPSDGSVLDLLRQRETMTVSELAEALEVTATAVRQRLNRLMGQKYVSRRSIKAGRGRPSHRYQLTRQGRQHTGSNFADLAMALWGEIRDIADVDVRRGLLQRISRRLASAYADRVPAGTLSQRMEAVAELFGQRRLPFAVDTSGDLPVLTAWACPYPELAEEDRTVCAMERMLFTEILGERVRLTKCRLNGDNCCSFTPQEGGS